MQDIEKIKRTNKIKVPLIDVIISYRAFPILVSLNLILILLSINSKSIAEYNEPVIAYITVGLTIIITLMTIFYISLIHGKFKLKLINHDVSHINLDFAIRKASEKLRWRYEKISANEYHLVRPGHFPSHGEIIYVITYDNKLFINSFSIQHPIVFNYSKKNIELFKKHFMN